MAWKSLFLFLLLLLPSLSLPAQEEVPSLWLEEAAEEWAGDETDGYQADWDELARLREHPINLNAATAQQLRQLPFLSEYQIDGLLEYVGEHGPMQTLGELQLVRGMDWRTIRYLRPYVYADGSTPPAKRPLTRGRHELEVRLDHPFYTRQGYRRAYLGNKQYQSIRWRYQRGDRWQMGFAAEKDAGEPWGALHNRWGYDHYAFFVQGMGEGWLQQWVAGCYRLSFGEGVVMGNGFLNGKSFTLQTASYTPQGIRPFASTDENQFLQGAAVALRPAREWQLVAFASYRRIDAIVKADTITSIQQTGLHRTATEAMRKDTSAMYAGGLHLGRSYLFGQWGVTAIGYGFDRPYHPSLKGYARYRLRGERFYNLGADYRLHLRGFHLCGEIGKGMRGWGLLNKLSYQFSGNGQWLLLHRYYSHDYWAYFAHAFAEGSSVQNENGWYTAIELPLTSRWLLFASADWFQFPWWRYGISTPSDGIDLRAQLSRTSRSKATTVTLSYRYKQGLHDVAGTQGRVITSVRHHRLRLRYQWTGSLCTLRTTADYNHYQHVTLSPSQGFQATQLLTLAPPRRPLSGSLQATWFCTDDYNSRVYVSEPGLLHTFYQPVLSGHGLRASLRLRYQPCRSLTLLLKLGHTHYFDRTTIGSGNDLISSSQKSDLQFQLRCKF